jgi:hypothetical protein
VAYACNPSYSGGRDQKDHSSKPALANCSRDLISKKKKKKKTFTKQGLVAQGWWLKVNVLSSNLNTTKKEKEKENSPSL